MHVKIEIYDEKQNQHFMKKADRVEKDKLIDLVIELVKDLKRDMEFVLGKKTIENNRVDMDEDVESFLIDDEECDDDFEDYLGFEDSEDGFDDNFYDDDFDDIREEKEEG